MRLPCLSRAALAAWAVSAMSVPDSAAAWSAQELRVANDGVDSSSCGAAESPCRSISQAIRNARPAATIRVGPGIYGEFTGDRERDAGEEGPRDGREANGERDDERQGALGCHEGTGATGLNSGSSDRRSTPVPAPLS